MPRDKLDESSDIIQALRRLAERCFNLVGEMHFVHGAILPSPLTLLRIMQQLQPFIDGGGLLKKRALLLQKYSF